MSGREVPSSIDPSERSSESTPADRAGRPEKPGELKTTAGAIIIAIIAAGAAIFFKTNPGIWRTAAEPFYTLIFSAITVGAIAYLAKKVYDRRTWKQRYG